ncbi:hypothetical protein F8388_025909 [Cannabis sativa]|uniref:Uncharacterized protein n=1 Tax=Cannabis sativa TaxID=3483 RepID=A0A7J6EK53_CANSA|nr:hypothetical protein F8388_025909 [Cannabis sativa]KAF4358069.1 hypothetical protein G4B88_021818 [Cannabis sativa]
METGTVNHGNEPPRVVLKYDSWFSQFRNASNPWMARYVYAFMFLIANLLAWAARDYSKILLPEMEKLKGCDDEHDCLGAHGVLRTFYFTMFLTTVGTSKLNDRRDVWQSGWWSAKIVLWAALLIIPFLLPSPIIQFYGEIAHFGAGYALVNAGILTPGLMGLEPAGENCIRRATTSGKTDWLSIISFIIAILAMVIATFSTGIDSQCFKLRKEETPSEEDVPYGYGFFHFVFATGAMYFAMLLISWNPHHTMKSMDACVSCNMEGININSKKAKPSSE